MTLDQARHYAQRAANIYGYDYGIEPCQDDLYRVVLLPPVAHRPEGLEECYTAVVSCQFIDRTQPGHGCRG